VTGSSSRSLSLTVVWGLWPKSRNALTTRFQSRHRKPSVNQFDASCSVRQMERDLPELLAFSVFPSICGANYAPRTSSSAASSKSGAAPGRRYPQHIGFIIGTLTSISSFGIPAESRLFSTSGGLAFGNLKM